MLSSERIVGKLRFATLGCSFRAARQRHHPENSRLRAKTLGNASMKDTFATVRAMGLAALGLLAASNAPALAGKGLGPGHLRIVSVAGAGPVKTERTNFDVTGGKLATSVGCNRIAGPMLVKGSSVKIGPLVSTQRACVPKLGDLEQAYLTALGRVVSYKPRGSGATPR